LTLKEHILQVTYMKLARLWHKTNNALKGDGIRTSTNLLRCKTV